MHSKIKFVLLCLIFVAGASFLSDGQLTGRPRTALALASHQELTPTPRWIEPEERPSATPPPASLPEPTLPTAPPRPASSTACIPVGDQVALFSQASFGGECVVKERGSYADLIAIGLMDDSIASIQVGGFVVATLCQGDKFSGPCEVISGDDPDLSDNGTLNGEIRSLKVEGCLPGPGQAALFSSTDYSGRCLILNTGIYTDSASLDPVGNNSAESLRVASGTQAILCDQKGFGGPCEAFLADMPNLSGSTIGLNTASSAKIEGLPDLRPLPVFVTSAPDTEVTGTLLAGSPTYFDWHFENTGTITVSNNFTAEFWVDSIRFANYPFDNARAGSVLGFDDWVQIITDPGWHTVRLVVDPGNTVTESDETNNVWQGQFFWAMPDSWRGEYFNNETLTGAPVLVRYDPTISFPWEYDSPGPGVNPDGFSVRWTRTVAFTAGGYEFTLIHDDGARIWVDGRLVLNKWDLCCQIDSVRLELDKGEHLLVVEFFDHYGAATARLSWRKLFDGYRSYMPVMHRP